MTFEQFDGFVRGAGLCAVQFHKSHWQIFGCEITVNFWPTSKGGPRFQVVGASKRSYQERSFDRAVDKAILCAFGREGEADSRHSKPNRHNANVDLLLAIASSASKYLSLDRRTVRGIPLDEQSARIELLKLLNQAGYSV